MHQSLQQPMFGEIMNHQPGLVTLRTPSLQALLHCGVESLLGVFITREAAHTEYYRLIQLEVDKPEY